MQTQTDIHFEFSVPVSAELAFAAIANAKGWWIRNTEGPTASLGESFIVNFNAEGSFVRFTVTEAQPGSRLVWHVDDCFLPWFADKTEWNGTDVIFEIAPAKDGSVVTMVHRGLTPEVECYNLCTTGWEGHFMKSLRKLIEEGTGTPQ